MSKTTELILRAEVENLGHVGDIVEVKPGYARNYLLPQGLAYVATESNKRLIEQERENYELQLREEKGRAEAVAASMANLELEFSMMAGDEDQLYGSVSVADIGERLNASGFDIATSQVRLDAPIKMLGEYDVMIHLHPEVDAPVKIRVVRELG